MKKMSVLVKSFLGIGISMIFCFPVFAAAPEAIAYQGKLTDSSGVPVPDATYTIYFSVWDSLSGGINIVPESGVSVGTVNGVFSAVIPISAAVFTGTGGAERYLQLRRNGNSTPFSPRQKMVAAPYALSVAEGSVDTNEIKNGSVTNPKIGAGAVSGGAGGSIANGTVDTINLKDGAVTNLKIGAGAVSGGAGGSIANGTVDAVNLKDGAVTNLKIGAGAVSGGAGGSIANGTVDAVNLKDGAVTNLKIGAGAVSGGAGGSIANGTVDAVNLKDGAVTNLKIGAGAVSGGAGGSIADGAVDTINLKDNAVSKTKINSGDLIPLFKTSDGRLLADGSYSSALCGIQAAEARYFDCDGTCNQTSSQSCTGSLVGSMIKQ